jgi:hypothetical protein
MVWYIFVRKTSSNGSESLRSVNVGEMALGTVPNHVRRSHLPLVPGHTECRPVRHDTHSIRDTP